MVAAHFTTLPCKPNTANRHIESNIFLAKFVPVPTKLCMLGLKFLELSFAFYGHFEGVCMLRIIG